MRVCWKKLCIRLGFWILAEIYLGFLGLDDLADYSEFLFEPRLIVRAEIVRIVRSPNVERLNHFA